MFKRKICSIFAVVIGVVLLQISEGSAADSKVIGKYKYNGDPNCPKMDKVFTLMGVTDAQKAMAKEMAPKMTSQVSKDGETYTVIVAVPMKQIKNKFESGKEYKEENFIGPKTTTTATVDGDKITWVRKLENGKELTEVFECRDDGCTSNYNIGEDTGSVEWKREK